MSKIGYARVSSTSQNLDRQIEKLNAYGVDKLFMDKQSGKNMNRPEWHKLNVYLREGDELVITSLDRLSRNYDDIKATVKSLQDQHIKLKALEQPYLDFNTNNETLNKFMLDMLVGLMGFVADNERQKIRERQSQGIAIAKSNGKYKGKQREYSANAKNPAKRMIYNKIVDSIPAIENKQVTINGLADELGISRTLIYRIRKQIKTGE